MNIEPIASPRPAECSPAETRAALHDVIRSLWAHGLSSAEIAVRIGSAAFEAEVERVRLVGKEA